MATQQRSRAMRVALGVLLLVLLELFVPRIVFSQTSTDNDFAMPYESYFIAGGCHADGWGTGCALDVNNSINGGALLSPITGRVVSKGENDGYGNPYLILDNSRWKVYMLHGIYNLVVVGDSIVIGQHIGTEASIGRSTGPHTHLSLYDKLNGIWVNPLNVVTGANTYVSGQGLSQDHSLNPQPPGEVSWNTGVIGEFRIVADTTEDAVEAVSTSETATQTQTTESISENTSRKVENHSVVDLLRQFFAEVSLGWWLVMFVLLLFLTVNKHSRPWWPFWMVLLTIILMAFIWSRSTVTVFEQPVTGVAEMPAAEELSAELPRADTIVFPAIPEPIVFAIENNSPITTPMGFDYFPDPGPTMARTVEILWEVAEERGIPPQFLLAKLYYEGGYLYNDRWMGLRNWKPDGSMTKSYSYADCRGIGQVCKYYHPSFDQARAGDLSDPEEALRYSAGYAADFIVQLYNQTGDWSQVVMRYHGTQAEGSKGLQFTRNFIVSPPTNPETGQPAWPAVSLDIMN